MATGTTELDRFVREAMTQGHPRDVIASALLAAGWTQEQIAGALDDYAEVDFPIPVPKPRASLSARDAFLHLVLFATLYYFAFHLGDLWFDMIDHWLPDAAVDGNSYGGSWSSMRWSIASILIAFPVFVLVACKLDRELRLQPIKRLAPVRRWLTYLTLFIAATILISDFTVLLNSVLGGELSSRFLLKVLVVAIIAGTIFGYYLRDLRREEVTP